MRRARAERERRLGVPVARAVVRQVALVAQNGHEPEGKHHEVGLQRLERHRRRWASAKREREGENKKNAESSRGYSREVREAEAVVKGGVRGPPSPKRRAPTPFELRGMANASGGYMGGAPAPDLEANMRKARMKKPKERQQAA